MALDDPMPIKSDSLLGRAAALAHKGRYGEAIRMLEPEVVRYHDSFRYYYILAASCLYSGDYGGAHTYLRRARELKMRDSSVLLGLAALHLRRGETDRSIELYLDILDKDPNNRLARRALQVIRKHGDPEKLSNWIESGKLPTLYPVLPKKDKSSWGAAALISIVSICGILIMLSILGIIANPFEPRKTRQGMEDTMLATDERASPIQTGGAFRYILTRSQILESYDTARRFFMDYRDEAAKIELNRILESNASDDIKNKARILASYAAVPGFDTIKDRFSYPQVLQEPLLYRDCHVVWRGMAANLRMGDTATAFDLLVGYDTNNTLQGIVPVRLDFAVAVDIERPMEILGKISLVQDQGIGSISIRLVGLAVHQAASMHKVGP